MEYGGGRTESEIVSWVLKKSGPVSQEVDCKTAVEKSETVNLSAFFLGESGSTEH